MYAPAILTVGSIEYQLGRVEEAMELFMTLTTLPKDEKDLSTIIDKAGDFLIDQGNYENALAYVSNSVRLRRISLSKAAQGFTPRRTFRTSQAYCSQAAGAKPAENAAQGKKGHLWRKLASRVRVPRPGVRGA
jgi:tetratricopeptide (TPR) repeat protein